MKRLLIPILLLFLLFASACNNQITNSEKMADGQKETITYESEDGPVEVPANPQRVVVLSSFVGNVMKLGITPVGVDTWSMKNPRWKGKLKETSEVSEENLEKIIELNPDLIIGLSTTKNVDKLKKIAPTVTFTYGKIDYLQQHIEIGKLLNKEKEATAWVKEFKEQAGKVGQKIQAKIGKDATVTVVENFNKQLYVFGTNFGRGTEILYQGMGLNMPKKVEESATKSGYYAISPEVLPEFAGDYLIISKYDDTVNAYMESNSYKNIPAVKNGRAFVVNAREFYFNDPLTLDYQLRVFQKKFLGQ